MGDNDKTQAETDQPAVGEIDARARKEKEALVTAEHAQQGDNQVESEKNQGDNQER